MRIPTSGTMRIADTRYMTEIEREVWRDRWPNFEPRELDSSDFSLKMPVASLDRLQALRTAWGKPLIITSAYRSFRHNRAVRGARKSQHLKGRAFDIIVRTPAEGRRLEDLARQLGFRGIGRYWNRGFIHIDDRTGPQATWGKR